MLRPLRRLRLITLPILGFWLAAVTAGVCQQSFGLTSPVAAQGSPAPPVRGSRVQSPDVNPTDARPPLQVEHNSDHQRQHGTITNQPRVGFTHRYDPDGRVTEEKKTLPSTEKIRSFSYDALNRLTQEIHPDLGTTQFEYDANGNRKLVRRSSGTSTLVEYYGHDEADRLIWTNTGGNTPPSGTITSGPARAQYGYDEFGQVTSRVRRNADGTYITQRLKWDGAGRLAEASDDRRANPIFTATYTASGQRLTKADPVTGAHDYSYGLYDSRGLTTYLPAGGMQSGAGKLYALTDRLGSTRATTTAQGVVSERVRYDAWGRITAQTGAVPVGTPLYAGAWGYEREPEGVTGLGLDYLTHRYYDPQIGRFISRDPIRWDGGLNLYGYCENDPVNGVDPTGTIVESPWDLAMVIVDLGFMFADALTNAPPATRALNNTAFGLDLAALAAPGIPGGSGRGLALAGAGARFAPRTATSLAASTRGARAGLAAGRGVVFASGTSGSTDCPGPGSSHPSPRYTSKSRAHVFSHGHAANSPRMRGKSRFRPTEGGQKFADEVVNHPNTLMETQVDGSGRIRYHAPDLGRTTGRDAQGRPVRGGRVVLEQTGEVVTQFPQRAR